MVLMITAATFVSSCGPQAVGRLPRESQAVDLENAQSARAELRMGAGELNLAGGAEALMEADFTYNVTDWKPEVNYDISGDTASLS